MLKSSHFQGQNVRLIYSYTLFLSAFLLFCVQLIVAKMILPLLGGTPSVWNTCQFFFQATLLLGYGYAHLTTKWLGSRHQAIIHIALLFLPLLSLPLAIDRTWQPSPNLPPSAWLLTILLTSVGLPFFVISTTAPLLQKWFADTNHDRSSDPYFLYSASNIGSLLGLLSYPVLIEPYFSVNSQNQLWLIAYVMLMILTIGCGITLWRSGQINNPSIDDRSPTEPLAISQIFQWVVLAFIPSSLLLGVTTYITTDLAAIPLLWAIPLALYLLSFIFTFARRQLLPYRQFVIILPLLLTPLILLCWARSVKPLSLVVLLNLCGFFVAACVFHWQLVQKRPNPEHLTSFYWWISVGGVLGGWFNAIASPLVFNYLLEYPLMMLLSILVLPSLNLYQQVVATQDPKDLLNLKNLRLISLGILFGGLLVGFSPQGWQQNILGNAIALLVMGLIFWSLKVKKLGWVNGLCFVLLIGQFSLNNLGGILYSDRSFFGLNRVIYYEHEIGGKYHSLLHGTTLHGKQSLDPNRRNEPLSYFSPDSPIGQFFDSFTGQDWDQVGVLGLGVGTLAAYAQPGQAWTFYEIDPTVEEIATNPAYFTFLQDAQAPYQIILGDGRLKLAEIPDNFYDVLIMDAFSSDAIPVHLVTQEAFELYLRKLKPTGLLVVNISNRYIDLEPVLGAIADRLELFSLRQQELDISPMEKAMGKSASHWVIFTSNPDNFAQLVNDDRWQPIAQTNQTEVWTDDYSNIFQVLSLFGDQPDRF